MPYIEVSWNEILLVVYAGIVTSLWLTAREDSRTVRKMLMTFIEDKDAREGVVEAHRKWREAQRRQA